MLARLRILVVAVLAVLIAPAVGRAQNTAASASRAERTPSASGPRLELTATAARHVTQVSEDATVAARRRQSAGKPAALMIVGGAAVILGAIIGDTVGTLFMVGGAVAFLYGLFLYLE
jgi:hypothetical protein